jgi:hypothetical protein
LIKCHAQRAKRQCALASRADVVARPLNLGVRWPQMPLPEDVERAVAVAFAADRVAAARLLAGAVLDDGRPANARLLRCALVGSGGSLSKLEYYVTLLKVDWRDVVVAGEYDSASDKLMHVRDLTQPLPSNLRWSGP